MSVSTTTNKIQYSPNGATTVFAYDFLVLSDTQVKVIITDAEGVDTEQELSTDYAVSGVGAANGGTVIMSAAPASGTVLTIKRASAITQLVDYVINDRFPAETHEQALDKLTLICQEINEVLARCPQYPETEAGSIDNLFPAKADRLGKSVKFDEVTGHLVLMTSADPASLDNAVAAAQAAQAAAEAVLDVFDDRYLGTKSSDPALDNDGNALIDGALYWNTTDNRLKVYDLGNTVWIDFVSASIAAQIAAEAAASDAQDSADAAATAVSQRMLKDGSNFNSYWEEGDFSAAVQAKLNTADGSFQGFHDASGAAPSTAGLTANADYYKVSVAGNGATTSDLLVFNGGSAGNYTDFDIVAISTAVPASGSITRDMMNSNIRADLGSITEPVPAVNNMVVAGPSGAAGINLTPTGFEASGTHTSLSVRSNNQFSIESGQVITINWDITVGAHLDRIRIIYWNGSTYAEAHLTSERITVAANGSNTDTITVNATVANAQCEIFLSDGTSIAGTIVSDFGVVLPGLNGTYNDRLDALEANEEDLSGVSDQATARTNIGLGNVDNTSDANKPVSTAQQAALDLKANSSTVTALDTRVTALEDPDSQEDSFYRREFFELKGSESNGEQYLATMPALDFGTRDCSFGGPVKRQRSRQLVCSNVSANVGVQLWWNEDATFTLIFGNGSDLTTYSWTTANKAWIDVEEWARVYVTLDRDDQAIIYVNGVALDDGAGAIERLDISAASAQTLSSGGLWYFGSDGSTHTPCALAELWSFEKGFVTEEIMTERLFNPTAFKRTWLRSFDLLPVESLLLEYGTAGLSRLNAAYVDLVGQSDWLRLDATLENNSHYLNFPDLLSEALTGDDIRVECDVYVPSGNTESTGFRIDVTQAGINQQILFGAAAVTQGKVIHISANITAANTQDRLRVWVTKGGTTSYNPGVLEYVYIRNLHLFVNGVQRVIDFRTSGTTKTDRIGANDATRNASATDID